MASTYPVWRFHQEKQAEGLIVHSEEQDLALGEGWVDSPAKFKASVVTGVFADSFPQDIKDPVEAAPARDRTPAEDDARKPRKRKGTHA